MSSPLLVLGSSSESRITMLEKIGYKPDIIEHPEVDETPLKNELPQDTAVRLAIAKASKIHQKFPDDIVIAADTVCSIGRMQLPKALTESDVRFCLKRLSGRRNKTYTGICGIRGNTVISKLGMTIIKFKLLSHDDIEEFVSDKKQWYGKAGGFTLMGLAAAFITMISGDEESNVIGLPLYHARNIIKTLSNHKIIKR
jgi:septum formation protein